MLARKRQIWQYWWHRTELHRTVTGLQTLFNCITFCCITSCQNRSFLDEKMSILAWCGTAKSWGVFAVQWNELCCTSSLVSKSMFSHRDMVDLGMRRYSKLFGSVAVQWHELWSTLSLASKSMFSYRDKIDWGIMDSKKLGSVFSSVKWVM